MPDDNPFVGQAGYRPEVFTMGHRSPESLVIHGPTGQIWQGEMGPNGGDEINILVPGGNYGWQLQRIVFNENMEELRRESLLSDLGHRIREVKQGPDELLYVLTDHADGALLRIEPAD